MVQNKGNGVRSASMLDEGGAPIKRESFLVKEFMQVKRSLHTFFTFAPSIGCN